MNRGTVSPGAVDRIPSLPAEERASGGRICVAVGQRVLCPPERALDPGPLDPAMRVELIRDRPSLGRWGNSARRGDAVTVPAPHPTTNNIAISAIGIELFIAPTLRQSMAPITGRHQ